jgi:ribokinase
MTRVAVVGSANLDLIATTQHLPRPGETVLAGVLSYRNGGKGANQALAAHRFGASVAFLGAVGDDDFGHRLRAGLARAGLDLAHVRVMRQAASGVALILVDEAGENMITVAPGANHALTVDDVAGFAPSIDAADVLLLQLEIPIAVAHAAARLARRSSTLVVLNAAPAATEPGGPLKDLVSDVDVLLVNESEAMALGAQGASWAERTVSLLDLGPATAVVTLGSDGAVAACGLQLIEQPAFDVDVVDAVGAGDAFSAALTVELAERNPLDHAVRTACAAGALATTGAGAQDALPSRARVESWLTQHPEPGNDVRQPR